MKLLSPDHIARMATATEWRYPDFSYCNACCAILEPLPPRVRQAYWTLLCVDFRRTATYIMDEDCGEALIAVVDALEREEAA